MYARIANSHYTIVTTVVLIIDKQVSTDHDLLNKGENSCVP